MPKPEQSAEPSIEEILASIRRIIADDGAPAKGPGARPFPKPAGDPHRGEPHGGPVPRPTPAYHPMGEMAEPRGDDELLELTEDFLLEEPELAAPAAPAEHDIQPMRQHGAPSQPAEIRTASAAAAPLAAFEIPVDAGLQSVLSNVAAEVERLAAAEMTPSPSPSTRLFGGVPQSMEAPAAESRPRAAAPAAAPQPDRLPQPEMRAAPAAPPQQAAARPRTHSRPVWSARRLEGGPAPRNEQPAAPDLDAPEEGLPPQAFGGRDRWEEGVQMPVPESGPQIPFPYAPELEAKGSAAPAKPAAAISAPPAAPAPAAPDSFAPGSPLADLDSEKSFVGDFLSRVFGGAHPKAEEFQREEPGFDEPGLKGKAEKLAKATISDFASDKLKAPSLADVLHADKPFMAQLTDSLETALAEVEARDELDSEPERSMLQAIAGRPNAPALAGDELPEEPPLVEADLPFAAPDQELPAPRAVAAVQATQPVAPVPPSAANGQPQPPHGFHLDPIFEDRRTESVMQMPSGIEDSIKDMIKPLIVQWLNENLSRIVEQAVREELSARRGEFAGGGNAKR